MRCEDSRYFFLLTFALVIITQEFGVGVGVSVCGAFFFLLFVWGQGYSISKIHL